MDNELITKKEINCFLWFIEATKNNKSIITFAKNLDYELFSVLLEKNRNDS